jgi:hypothetical protein
MNNATLAMDSPSQGLLLLAPGKKAVRPVSSPHQLPFRSKWEAPTLPPVSRHVPIVAWQQDSWTKKILAGKVRPSAPEKVRVLRLKKS